MLYTSLGEVKVKQKGFGFQSGTKYYPVLTEAARELGADAVIEVHEWRGISMTSWSAVRVGGTAVSWSQEARAAVIELDFACY